MTETVLVAGGAGYVGSHTCKALARAGYLPVVYDNLVSGHEWAVKWGPLERGDILDANRLGEVMRHHRPTALFHFAAFASVSESVAAPAKYYLPGKGQRNPKKEDSSLPGHKGSLPRGAR